VSESRVRELAGQISGVRDDFGQLLTELEKRRREATDVKLQARRHPRAAAGVVALAVGIVTYLVRRRLRHRRELRDPLARRRRLREAFSRMAEDPARVQVGQGVARSLAAAAGTAFVTSLARRVAAEAAAPRRRARVVTPATAR
jgi:hypothetical protein